MSCCDVQEDGRAAGGGAPLSNLFDGDEIDFTQQTAGNVVIGNNSLTTTGGVPLIWTGTNTGAGATNFDFVAGGLRCVLNNVSTVWSSVTQDGPGLYIPLSSLHTAYASRGFDASCNLWVRMYCSTITWVGNTVAPSGLHIAFWGLAGVPSNSALRYTACIRFRQAGVECMSSRVNASGGSNYTTAPADTSNVFGIANLGGGLQMLGGVWGGSWGTSPLTIEANTLIGTATTNSSFRDRNNRLAITFSTGSVAISGSTLIVERIRWDWQRSTLAA